MRQNANLTSIGEALGLKSSGFTFLNPSKVTAPYTSVRDLSGNSRQLLDPSKTLKASMGIERVHVKSISVIPDETTANGDRVWKSDDDESRIRFVGNWSNEVSIQGTSPIASSVAGDYVEVTFYGTGLNWLMFRDAGARDHRVTVDGGAEGANIYVAGPTIGITQRSYASNQILNVVSGLTLGIHTVKIRNASANDMRVFGFEILNQSSSIKFLQGEAIFAGKKFVNSSEQSSSYNSGFDGSPVLNGNGGRVVTYIKNGIIGKAIQQAVSSPAYLSSADHSNEEVIRRINFREFGANRADDLSTLGDTVSDRMYTLDDGTTTLVGNDVRVFTSGGTLQNAPGLYVNSTGSSGGMTIIFVGTGIDFINNYGNAAETITIYVDGVSVGTIPYVNNARNKLVTIASGLPYGTHSVRLERGGGFADFMNTSDFIIYGPKTPEVPAGAIEIGSYGLLATFSDAALDTNNYRPPVGAVYKAPSREFVYRGSGTWTVDPVVAAAYQGMTGQAAINSSNGAIFEYTFTGTDIALMFGSNSSSTKSYTIAIDGVLNASASVFGGATNGGGGAYTIPIGTSLSRWIVFKGLTFGRHTVTVTCTDATGNNTHNLGVFVNTLIHSPNVNVGSNSISDVIQSQSKTVTSGVDLSKAKAWIVIDLTNSVIKSSYNIASVLKISTGSANYYFERPFKSRDYAAVIGSVNGMSYRDDSNVRSASFDRVVAVNNAGSASDTTHFSIAWFGELQDE